MKKKVLLGFGFGLLSVVSLAFLTGLVFGIVGIFYNPFLAPQMTKYYSNDNNYYQGKGTISEIVYEKDSLFKLYLKEISVKNNDGDKQEKKSSFFRIYSIDINQTYELLNPEIGLEIDFYCSFNIFYHGQVFPIIQITANGEEILSFEEGKEALLEWASRVH